MKKNILLFIIFTSITCSFFVSVISHEVVVAEYIPEINNNIHSEYMIPDYIQPLSEWKRNPKYKVNQSLMNMMVQLENEKS